MHVRLYVGFMPNVCLYDAMLNVYAPLCMWERVCMIGREQVRLWVVLMVLAYVGHKLSMYVLMLFSEFNQVVKLLCAWLRVCACVEMLGTCFGVFEMVWEAVGA